MQRSGAGVETECSPQQAIGLLMPAVLTFGHAEELKRGDMVRDKLQDLSVKSLRIGNGPGAVKCPSAIEHAACVRLAPIAWPGIVEGPLAASFTHD